MSETHFAITLVSSLLNGEVGIVDDRESDPGGGENRGGLASDTALRAPGVTLGSKHTLLPLCGPSTSATHFYTTCFCPTVSVCVWGGGVLRTKW